MSLGTHALALPLAPKSREIRVWRSDAVFCLMSVWGGCPHDLKGCPDHDNMTRGARLCHTTAFCPASVCQQRGRHTVAASITAKLHLSNIHQPSCTQHIFCAYTCALSVCVCVNKCSIFNEDKNNVFAMSWLNML